MKDKLKNGPEYRRPLDGTGVRRITESKMMKNTKPIRICTWNARSAFEDGKTHNIVQEMNRLKVEIMGISEMRWKDSGYTKILDHSVYYSGNDDKHHRNGVAILVTKEINNSIKNVIYHSDRIIMVQLKATPFDINIVQVYYPTADKDDTEIEEVYGQLEKILKSAKNNEVTIVMGDFNAKIGQGKEGSIVGQYGLGTRNTRGDRLVQFCREKERVIMNTFFKLPPRRLYTWTSPADTVGRIIRNQIDYITINHRFRNSITSAKTYPGADIGSDHNPLIGVLQTKLKKVKKQAKPPVYDIRKIREDNTLKETVSESLTKYFKTNNSESLGVQEDWSRLQNELDTIIKKHVPLKKKEKHKEWMTPDIFKMMEERRNMKGKDQGRFTKLNRQIRSSIRKAKEDEMKTKCLEIENLQKKYDLFNMHRRIKEAAGTHKKQQSGRLIDANGNEISEIEEKLATWEEYIQQLFEDDRPEHHGMNNTDTGPHITKEEVQKAIDTAKNGKAVGPDKIPAEILKLFSEEGINTLTRLYNVVYDTGEIPTDWLHSTFVTIPKKPTSKKCEEYRTISIMSHTLKIFLKIIHARIYQQCEANIEETQFGFRNAVGTREALFALNVLIQRCRDINCDVYLCFIDFSKAFDRVKHEELISILRKTGADDKNIRIIAKLYWQQTAEVRVGDHKTKKIKICRGVRQGCVLSPILFNIYSEQIFKEALDSVEGIIVNGELLNNIRYADDSVIMSSSAEGLQIMMEKIKSTSEKYGICLNIKKTKHMVVSKNNPPPVNLFLDNTPIEQVDKYTYLGTCINQQWDHSVEIKCRIERARAAFIQMKKIFTSPDLTLQLKIRILRCYVFSTLLYGAESWTLTKDTESRLEAFELWTYRHILKVTWIDHVTNEEILRRVGKDREIMTTVKVRKLEYLGHVMRHKERYRILQLILEGKVLGKRGPGRRRISWLKNLRQWFGVTSIQLFRGAVDKVKIAMMIANIRNG